MNANISITSISFRRHFSQTISAPLDVDNRVFVRIFDVQTGQFTESHPRSKLERE
jgi:hypothetical protein